MRTSAWIGFVMGVLAAGAAGAQTGTLIGSVSADSFHKHWLVGAEITIPALNALTHSNFAGDYQLTGLKPGRYVVQVRAAGYRSIGDSVTIAAGDTYHDFVFVERAGLLADVPTLDTVRTKAESTSRFISPALRGFEERRREGFGQFITEAQMRKYDDDPLTSVLVQVPGMMVMGGRVFSSRAASSKGALIGVGGCPVAVYIDGALLWNYNSKEPPPDFRHMDVNQYAGAEYYAGAADAPIFVSRTNNECGVLLLWTRER